VCVRIFASEPGRSPKLQFLVTGPHPVVHLFDTGVESFTAKGRQRLHMDRVIKAQTSKDLPSGVDLVPILPYRRRISPQEKLDDI
jgi:hypothetical protein